MPIGCKRERECSTSNAKGGAPEDVDSHNPQAPREGELPVPDVRGVHGRDGQVVGDVGVDRLLGDAALQMQVFEELGAFLSRHLE